MKIDLLKFDKPLVVNSTKTVEQISMATKLNNSRK
jgi:hypothetical protein